MTQHILLEDGARFELKAPEALIRESNNAPS